MFKYFVTTINDEEYLGKTFGNKNSIIAINHKKRFSTTINMDTETNYTSVEHLSKKDIVKLGFESTKYSPLQIINSEERIDANFLFENNTFIQSIDLAKNLAHYASDKNKGLLIFENNNEFKTFLTKNKVEFDTYDSSNIKVSFSDLDERVLLETMSLSDNEKAVVAAFLQFRTMNRENEELNIATLDGSNWMADIFHTNPVTLSQQFNIPEHNIRLIKTKLIQLKKLTIMDDEKSSIKEILNNLDKGKTIIIDVTDEQKRIIKSALNLNSKHKINVIDNEYLNAENITYLFYNKQLNYSDIKDFKNLIINKYSYHLREHLIDTFIYQDELNLLSFEYILITEDRFPIIITNEDHVSNETNKSIKVSTKATSGFF